MVAITPSVPNCPGWEPDTRHSLAAGGVRGMKANICWGRGHRAQVPENRRAWGRNGVGGRGRAEKAQAELDRPPHQKKKKRKRERSAKPQTHTVTDTRSHHPYSKHPSPAFGQGSSEDRIYPSGPIPSQPPALQRTSWQQRPPHPTPELHHQLQPTSSITFSTTRPCAPTILQEPPFLWEALLPSIPALGPTGGQARSQLRRPQPLRPREVPCSVYCISVAPPVK